LTRTHVHIPPPPPPHTHTRTHPHTHLTLGISTRLPYDKRGEAVDPIHHLWGIGKIRLYGACYGRTAKYAPCQSA
jgi:hypothetical protein